MYLSQKHFPGTLPAPEGTVSQDMDAMSPAYQRKNAQDIYNFLEMQGNDLLDLNGEDTLFTTLLSAPGTHQVKVVYRMVSVT